MKATAVFVAGVAVTAFGALFALQGAGIVRWPAESFMVGTVDWIEYGIVIAMIGIGLIAAAARMRRSKR
jgi:hypothetical protein